MSKYSLGKSGLYSSRFRSGVAAIFSPRVRRERARRDGFRPDITDEDVRERYYSRDLTIEDVVKYELYDDVEPSELEYSVQGIARTIGIRNLGNIDAEALSSFKRKVIRTLESSDLTPEATKEDIDAVLVAEIRETLDDQYVGDEEFTRWCELGITREKLPEFIVEFPEGKEELAKAYMDKELTLQQIAENMDVFKGKKIFSRLTIGQLESVRRYGLDEAKLEYICENVPELLGGSDYEIMRAGSAIDVGATVEENRTNLGNHYKSRNIDNNNAKIAIKFVSLDELIAQSTDSLGNANKEFIELALREVDEKTLMEIVPFEALTQPDMWKAASAIRQFGFTPFVEFERENGPLFTQNNLENLKYLQSAYLHYAGNRSYSSPANLYVKSYEAGDRPYTLEEFNEVMRRVIIYGPSDGTAKTRLDYRMLQGPFRDNNPDLFLPVDADPDLQDKFYRTGIKLEDLEQHPEYLAHISHARLDMCLEKPKLLFEGRYSDVYTILEERTSKDDVLAFISEHSTTIKYLNKSRESLRLGDTEGLTEIQALMERKIEEEILTRAIKYSEDAPEFFRTSHPEMFLAPEAPEKLKLSFYDDYLSQAPGFVSHHSSNYRLTFKAIGENKDWSTFLKGKDIRRAMPGEYSRLFELIETEQLMKLSGRNGESLDKMVGQHKEVTLANWYNATGAKFIPHHTVMLNFPEQEMDAFLTNGKKWSQLARIDRFNFNDDGKTATLKLAYAMGTFHGDDAGYKRVVDMLTLPPNSISSEDYEKVMAKFADNPEKLALIQEVYTLGEDGRYTYKAPVAERGEGVDQKEAKKIADGKVADVRLALEKAEVSNVLTPAKAHQMFDSFDMKYDPKFVEFFMKHQEEIMANPDYIKDIALIQRRFSEITRDNAGRTLTLELAAEYIRSNSYEGVEIGNEGLAEQARIAGYSQRDFDRLQVMYNEGQARDYSSIPRVTGEKDGYTYEMLRCDDPLALSIGTLTDCCQEIGGAGQTSMEHSVLSEDGRVFVVRDAEGRIVAQSWFWRNQYTGCFDNIEIPNKIFTTYEREHPEEGRAGLTRAVLGVYKQATMDLMREDERVYKELLDAGTITQEQYDALRLGKVTIGLGYNDIAGAIKSDSEVHLDTNPRDVIQGGRVPHPYTDAGEQYVIAEREGIIDSKLGNLHVHEDTIPVYDGSNLPGTTVTMMKKMEKAAGKDDLEYVQVTKDGVSAPPEQLVTRVAREYGLNPEITKVAATSRMAVVYSAEEVGPVRMGSVLTAPVSEELTEEEQKKAREHIDYQLKKTLRQITANGKRVLDIDSLPEADRVKVEELLQVIKKENEERGPRE